ncbi:hypothetical protein P691DRAFT_800741 [Macrolepiota fuliginosa MF-IS2]|uniref:Uncharacterized protein n=1 Tax=Macrolepiota fuliginosa MF-IS2 TaxID=1400762 RepID=A0A9P5XMC6_9AGAR|nr:hypothetical protein P691DRAFT_800741 [Macrolepiota fuliginosa MF-IS2]
MDSPPPSAPRPLPSSTSEHLNQRAVNTHPPSILHHGPFPEQQRRSVFGLPPTSSHDSWSYSPVFGIVHSLSGCSTCNSYVDHMVLAGNRNDVSLARALEARKESQDVFFMDGFGEGMRHQRDNDLQLDQEFDRLRSKLDTTTNAFQQKVAENELLRKELDRVKQQLTRLGGVPGLLLTSQNSPMANLPTRSPPSSSGSLGLGSRGSSVGSSADFQHHVSQDTNPTSPRPSSTKTDLREEDMSFVSAAPNNKQPSQADDPARSPCSTYAYVASNPHTVGSPSSHGPSNLPLRPRLFAPLPTSSAHQPTVAPRSQADKPRARHPRTMKELKDLMDLAREQTSDGAAALSIVKSVCSRAHGTPRDSKTFMQKWILMNWKNPYTATTASSIQAADVKPNPRIDDPVEVWYEYLCAHPHSWPKGVRKDGIGRPIMSDLVANRAVARMRPTELAALRNDYIAHVTDMFAIPGKYKQLLEENKFVIASKISYEPFTGPVSSETVARHFAESGFMPADATNNFEPWAKHYKEC